MMQTRIKDAYFRTWIDWLNLKLSLSFVELLKKELVIEREQDKKEEVFLNLDLDESDDIIHAKLMPVKRWVRKGRYSICQICGKKIYNSVKWRHEKKCLKKK